MLEANFTFRQKSISDSLHGAQKIKNQANSFEIELKAEENKREMAWLVALFLIVTCLLIGTGLWFNQKKKKELNVLYNEVRIRNKENEKTLAEKEVLLNEIHHRVKNNLQIISGILQLQSNSTELPEVKRIMEEGLSKISTISIIHEKLYQSEVFDEINMKEYIEDLLAGLSSTFNPEFNQSIEANVICPNINVNINTAVPLGLIINELFTNSVKYGLSKSSVCHFLIQIDMVSEQEFNFLCTDSGPGFTEDNMTKNNSLGVKMIRSLFRQLGGQVKFEQTKGARIVGNFKLNLYT